MIKTLNLDIKFDEENRLFRIYVNDADVVDLCLSLTLLKFELIESLRLSSTCPLQLLKIPTKKSKKLASNVSGYAVQNDKSIDLRVRETVLDDWLKFYLQYQAFNFTSNVDHDDYIYYSLSENRSSVGISITFLGAGYQKF